MVTAVLDQMPHDHAHRLGAESAALALRVGVMRKASRSHVSGEWEDELLMEYVV